MIIESFRRFLALILYREVLSVKAICPEQQQDKSPHEVQTLEVVVADHSDH